MNDPVAAAARAAQEAAERQIEEDRQLEGRLVWDAIKRARGESDSTFAAESEREARAHRARAEQLRAAEEATQEAVAERDRLAGEVERLEGER